MAITEKVNRCRKKFAFFACCFQLKKMFVGYRTEQKFQTDFCFHSILREAVPDFHAREDLTTQELHEGIALSLRASEFLSETVNDEDAAAIIRDSDEFDNRYCR